MMAMAAPSEAPDEIPKMYGSQMGLRKMVWNAAPHRANAPPASKLSKTLGIRRFHMVIS